MIPRDFIDELLARVDLVDVVGKRLKLKKSGANYFACCPFHGEKTPSFSVSPARQFYHCFGCGAHGTAITFLMEYEGLGFVDAVEALAAEAGLKVPRAQGAISAAEAAQQKSERQLLLELHAKAADFYRRSLERSPKARAYLEQRGILPATAERFGLGYAPSEWQALAAIFPHYSEPLLEKAGLVIAQPDSGKRYDRFRDRLIFPIHDRQGKIIAFGGRSLDGGEPKYLNSPETPLFEKGRTLYGLALARDGIREAGFALVTEGYIDVIMLAQHGLTNAVAALGTATTAEHVRTLLALTDQIVFCFDGDAAGRRAAWRALENSLEALKDDSRLRFVFLPPEHDPDSFVRAHGADAFRALITDEAKPLTTYLFDELTRDEDLHTAEGRARLAHLAKPLIGQIRAPMLRLQLEKELASRTGIAAETLHEWIPPAETASPSSRPAARRPRLAARRAPLPLAALLLRLLITHPLLASRLSVGLLPLEDPEPEWRACAAIIDAIDVGTLDAHATPAVLVEHFRASEHEEVLARHAASLLEETLPWEDPEATLADILHTLRRRRLEREIEALIALSRQRKLTPEETVHLGELLREKNRLTSVGTSGAIPMPQPP
ncbi:DNA primase [Tepidiphilus margaritifer]|uniref:DNA primase n=1 Tax=Tepidiphilus margaritifer TaxID=203471 RepID=UPI00042A1F10|nr:DNA primase [Tepidiphilus margaritifer]